MPSRAFKSFKKVIEGGLMSELVILQLKRALNERRLPIEEERELLSLFHADMEPKVMLTPSHVQKGLSWLRKYRSKQESESIAWYEDTVLKNPSHIELAGYNNLALVTGSLHERRDYVPRYRVVALNGEAFEYYLKGDELVVTGY